jgi:DNA-binding MarR family transcriptional regulator
LTSRYTTSNFTCVKYLDIEISREMPELPSDAVDTILEQWRRERPDLDLRALGLFHRLGRAAAIGEKGVAEGLVRHRLNVGEFDVLATLRRSGPPYRLSPTELTRSLLLSSGAMTNRLDRLEDAGLIERLSDPDDRRALKIALTRLGIVRIDAAVTDHVASEARLLAPLSFADQKQLSLLLRKLLAGWERADHGQE